jgi:hypothetical protein
MAFFARAIEVLERGKNTDGDLGSIIGLRRTQDLFVIFEKLYTYHWILPPGRNQRATGRQVFIAPLEGCYLP